MPTFRDCLATIQDGEVSVRTQTPSGSHPAINILARIAGGERFSYRRTCTILFLQVCYKIKIK